MSKNNRKGKQKLNNVVFKGPSRPQRKNNISIKPSKSPMKDHDGEVAGDVIRRLLDPCLKANHPALPDNHHGVTQTVQSVTQFDFDAHTGGTTPADTGKYIEIRPTPNDLLTYSTTTFATPGSTNDSQYSSMSIYKNVRLKGMCVRIGYNSASTVTPGKVLVACMPHGDADGAYSFPATPAAATALLTQNGAQSFNPLDGIEIAWCPRSQDDFAPAAYDLTYGSKDDNGRPLSFRPAITIRWVGADTSTPSSLSVTVSCIWECFLQPADQARGLHNSYQNSRAMDIAMSALPNLCWIKSGGTLSRVGSYAAKVSDVLGQHGFAAITRGLLGKISC